jgi:isoquinoline 1-oxidoreductase subunit beta
MPAIETHILPSKSKPSGAGEPGTPVIAPALAHALARIDGKPVRSLPMSAQNVRLA